MRWALFTLAGARRIDPILVAYILSAGVPLLVAMLAWGWLRLLTQGDQRRRLRQCAGQCVQCGYDLRATPDGSTLLPQCPECGAERTT